MARHSLGFALGEENSAAAAVRAVVGEPPLSKYVLRSGLLQIVRISVIEVDLAVVEVETGAALVAYAQSAGSEEASLGNSPGAHFVHLSAFLLSAFVPCRQGPSSVSWEAMTRNSQASPPLA